jgi:tRNA (guanine37-N1)-methyltransferase
MKFDIVTIFPAMVEAALAVGVIGRARESGRLDIAVHNLRDFTTDRHRVVDDVPFGGGPGMVMKPEPFFVAAEALAEKRGKPDAVLLMSPAGRGLTQADVKRWAGLQHLVVLCGRYEGVDDRVREHIATEEVSIGDYVLSGGEIAAMALIDACVRLLPGVMGAPHSGAEESFAEGLLEYPQYTRPQLWEGRPIPEVLLSGDHAKITAWRRAAAERLTRERRPERFRGGSRDA